MSVAAVVGAGLLAGALHVYLGPDHLAALAVLSLRSPSTAWRQGLRWGLGHCGGVLLVAALAFAFRALLDVDVLSRAGEALVGLTLVALGVWGFMKRRPEAPARGGAAYAVGILHGAAGTSHLLGVLPGLALPSAGLATAYLAAFSLTTILAMGLFAALLGWLGGRSEEATQERRAAWMIRAASAASVVIGAAWLLAPALGWSLP